MPGSCFRVRDPSGTEWSSRPYCGPAFGKVSVSSSPYGHLTLAVASRVASCGAGTTLGSINRCLLTVQTSLSYSYKLGFSLG